MQQYAADLISEPLYLPDQQYQQGDKHGRGERMLLAEILASAFRDLLLSQKDKRRRRALVWIFADDLGRITFPELCVQLGLDPALVRAHVRREFHVVRVKKFRL